MCAAVVPLPASGPDSADETMPPLAWLVPAEVRPQVMAFYHFAVTADDIADSPALGAEEKLARLDRLEEGLAGRAPAAEVAATLRAAVDGDALLLGHAAQLLQAFRRDAVSGECRDWADLMTYCRYSAVPVGHFLLDLHGEAPDARAAGDALCSALQILNLVQDCHDDYARLGRVYLPRDWLLAAGVPLDALAEEASPPELRQVLDEVLDGVDGLIELARPLPRLLLRRGLGLKAAVVIALAERLLRRLRREDPLAHAVRPGGLDVAAALATGLFRLALGR